MSLFQTDKHTERASVWIAGVDAFVMSSWALTEFSSALAVKTRMRNLRDRDRREFELQLDQWLRGRVVLSVVDGDMVEARRLVKKRREIARSRCASSRAGGEAWLQPGDS